MTLLNAIKEYGVWLLPIGAGATVLVGRRQARRVPAEYAGNPEAARGYRQGVEVAMRFGLPVFIASVAIALAVTLLRPAFPSIGGVAATAFHGLVLVWVVSAFIPDDTTVPDHLVRRLVELRLLVIGFSVGAVLIKLPEAIGQDESTLGITIYVVAGITLLICFVKLVRFDGDHA